MSQRLDQTCKLCQTKKAATATDKPAEAWQIVKPSTGQILQGLNYNGNHGGIDFAGQRWAHVSAFAWADKGTHVIPHFSEKGAKDMVRLYKAQTGDGDVQIVRILVA